MHGDRWVVVMMMILLVVLLESSLGYVQRYTLEAKFDVRALIMLMSIRLTLFLIDVSDWISSKVY